MLYRIVLIALIFNLSHTKMSGGESNSLLSRYYQWYSDENILFFSVENNPAIRQYIPLNHFNILSGNFSSRNSNTLHYTFKGDKNRQYYGNAEGFFKDEQTSLYGSAQYINGRTQNIRWSSVADPERIGPYHAADSTYRDNDFETYLLNGAITWQLFSGVSGISGSYRAESRYSTKDPRNRTVVSDFDISKGWAGKIMDEYLLGLSFKYGTYTQDLSITSSQSDRKDMFYFMYGYGMYNKSVSGTSRNYSTAYSGNSYLVSAQILPLKESGFFFDLSFEKEVMDADYHRRRRGRFITFNQNHLAGYQWQQNLTKHRVGLNYTHNKGDGTEYYYETVIVDESTMTSEIKLLSKATKYLRDKHDFSFQYNTWRSFGNYKIKPSLQSGIKNYSSQYRTTPYKEEVKQWYTTAALGLYHITESALSGVDVYLSGFSSYEDDLIVPHDNRFVETVMVPDHDYRSGDRIVAGITARYVKKMNNNNAWQVLSRFNLVNSNGETSAGVDFTIAYVL
ncbi:hypothetical protein QA597_09610 [Marinilabiliaceae bacterium ANBcel2]|nr:hypothetical protein [Marinilabiliaceae bacterium ANBcel2]